jgi:hypothetical protein
MHLWAPPGLVSNWKHLYHHEKDKTKFFSAPIIDLDDWLCLSRGLLALAPCPFSRRRLVQRANRSAQRPASGQALCALRRCIQQARRRPSKWPGPDGEERRPQRMSSILNMSGNFHILLNGSCMAWRLSRLSTEYKA